MMNNNIENFISMLKDGEISKKDFLRLINGIHFRSSSENTVQSDSPQMDRIDIPQGRNTDFDHNEIITSLKSYNEDSKPLNPTPTPEINFLIVNNIRNPETLSASKPISMTLPEFSHIESELTQVESQNNSPKFLKKLKNYEMASSIKRKNIEEEVKRKEIQECSFSPRINYNFPADFSKISSKKKITKEMLFFEKQKSENQKLA